jgi:hypothetical protein
MYIYRMRKYLDIKTLGIKETAGDVRDTARSIGAAAESQATLNIALTAVCVTALLVAVIVVRGAARAGAVQ